MSNAIRSFELAGIVILAIVVSVIVGCKGPGVAPTTAQQRTGPPVIVVGGSIEGQTYGTWTQDSKTCPGMTPDEWCSTTNGGTDFLTSYLYDPAINSPTIPTGESWTIHITDKNGNNPKAGVMLCGNAGCNESVKSDPNNVYLKPSDETQGHSGWDTSQLPYDISYLDKTCNPNGNCEHPDHAILSIGGTQASDSKCVAPKNYGCFVSAGQISVGKH